MKLSAMRSLVIIAVATILCAQSGAQPGPRPVLSIEYQVRRADRIFIGRVASYEKLDPATRTRFATIAVTETLKGHVDKQVAVRTDASDTDLRVWKVRNARLLCMSRYPQWDLFSIDDLDDPGTVFSKVDFHLIRDPKELERYVRETVRRQRGAVSADRVIVQPENDPRGRDWTEALASTPTEVHDGLAIPPDRRVEAMARRQLSSNDPKVVFGGMEGIRFFRSRANIALLKRLTKSPLYTVEKPAETNQGIDVRRYLVRSRAAMVLGWWGVRVPEPRETEEVTLYDTLETLEWSPATSNWQFEALKQFKKLKNLRFPPGTIFDRNLDVIGGLVGLESLSLKGSKDVTDVGVSKLAGLKNLHTLDLSGTMITDASVPALTALANLRTLVIDRTDITDDGLATILRSRPEVRVIPEPPISFLMLAMDRLDMDEIRRVLAYDPRSVERRDAAGNTPLHVAAGWQRTDVMKLLLDAGADPNAVNDEGMTPLLRAATTYHGEPKVVRMLMAHGANPNAVDKHGNNALRLAIDKWSPDLIPTVLAIGVNPLAKNDAGKFAYEVDGGLVAQYKPLLDQRVELLRNPVRIVPSVQVECRRDAYSLRPGILSNWSSSSVGRLSGPLAWGRTPSGRPYLGPFGQQAVTLTLQDLPAHRNAQIDVDLFMIGSWDGNGSIGEGPDVLDLSVPGSGTLMHSTFFNNPEQGLDGMPLQSFPDPYPLGFHKAYTGAAEVRSLGFVQEFPRDAVYRLHFVFAHSGPSLKVVLTGSNVPQGYIDNLTDDETWGVGALTVKTD